MTLTFPIPVNGFGTMHLHDDKALICLFVETSIINHFPFQ